MAISDKVSMALGKWGFDIAKTILPTFRIPQGSTIGNMMQGFLGINPASYNVWDELGFLAEPLIQSVVSPMVNKVMAGMSDEQAKDVVEKFVDSFIEQAKKKGSVNVFGIGIEQAEFESLKGMLTEMMKEE
jgi:hypothetical protein